MAFTMALSELDAHEQASHNLKAEWKVFSKMKQSALLADSRIDDPRAQLVNSAFTKASIIPKARIADAFAHLGPDLKSDVKADAMILFHPVVPGLLIIPDLIPPSVQNAIVDRLVHQELSNPKHRTNLHLHHDLPYPAGSTMEDRSFFSISPDFPQSFTPKDVTVHKPLTTKQALQRLHWMTLGGQYDWTNRSYSGDESPDFPADLRNFLGTLFPETIAQAAIVNFYSPGDTMRMHRDVSEEVNKGLISLSFGCDCLFMVAPSRVDSSTATSIADHEIEEPFLLLRLRSGDAIYMTSESRYAWHGVPKILKDTCPDYLENWPARDSQFTDWHGWMKNKRINLNVRQMRES